MPWTWNYRLTSYLPSTSADQLPRSSILALDVEFLHAGLQGGAPKAKSGRGAVGTSDFPATFLQGLEDPFALGRFFNPAVWGKTKSDVWEFPAIAI